MNGLAVAAFLSFGALLVLFGANASEILKALELDYSEFGLLASMLSLGIGSGILIAGPLVDRFPPRPLFIAACACVALTSLLLGPETTYRVLLAATFLLGLGAGFYETLLNAVIVDRAGVGAPRQLLFIHSAATLGASLTPFIIGLLREPLSLVWYDSFRAAGVLHVALIFATPLLPQKRGVAKDSASPSSTRSDRIETGKRPADAHFSDAAPTGSGHRFSNENLMLAAICSATFLYVGVESALTFFVGDFAENTRGIASDRAAGVVGFFWIGLLAGRLTIGLSPREPSARLTAVLSLAASTVVGAFFAGFSGQPELAMALTGFSLGGVFPIMIGLAGQTRPGASGTAVGLAAGIGSLGGFVIPWWTGLLATRFGLQTALLSLAVWIGLLALASFTVYQRHKN